MNLTREELTSYLIYDHETGSFKWRCARKGIRKGDDAGHVSRAGYIVVCIKRRKYPAHRLAWLYVHGRWPTHYIDHIDGNKANNRIENLREATKTENCRNTWIRSDNTSGYKGVHLFARTQRWSAAIHENGRKIHLGYFCTAEDAARAYEAAASKLFGEFANTGERK